MCGDFFGSPSLFNFCLFGVTAGREIEMVRKNEMAMKMEMTREMEKGSEMEKGEDGEVAEGRDKKMDNRLK
jgi:hypothetical protein